jgi:hypothetical protein
LPGDADITGPRTVRASPGSVRYAVRKMSTALANGTLKYS